MGGALQRFGRGSFAAAIVVSPDGSKVFVSGRTQEPGGASGYAAVAYDAATGVQLWARTYQAPTPSGVSPYGATAIAVSPDGSAVFVTGKVTTPSVPDEYSYGTVAYDAATGAQLWTATYAGLGMGAAVSGMAVSPDGSRVFVTGSIAVAAEPVIYNFATVAYSAATGAQLWVRRYHGAPASYDLAAAIATSPQGSAVFVTGGTVTGSSGSYATVSYDGVTGKTRWIRTYHRPGSVAQTSGSAAAVNSAGSQLFVTGVVANATDTGAYVTLGYDAATGARVWVRRDPSRGFLAQPAVAASPDGLKVFVTYSFRDEYYAVEAIDAATGTRLWRRIYTGLVEGVPDSIAVSPPGPRVFITGYSLFGTGNQYATLAYRG